MPLKTSNSTCEGLSEIRQKGKKIIEKTNGDIGYLFGETKDHRGVGFVVKKNLAKKFTEFKGISERLAIAKFKLNKNMKVAIFQVQAPTLPASKEEIKYFYRFLESTYLQERERYSIIIGDFNAKIGIEHEISGCTGPSAQGETNKNGFKLWELCLKLNMKVVNTFFNLLTDGR